MFALQYVSPSIRYPPEWIHDPKPENPKIEQVSMVLMFKKCIIDLYTYIQMNVIDSLDLNLRFNDPGMINNSCSANTNRMFLY